MYSGEITYRDYEIVFEYEYLPNDGLYLTFWQAYEGSEPVDIPCIIESTYIEKALQKWLDNECIKHCSAYDEDMRAAQMERRLSFMEDR